MELNIIPKCVCTFKGGIRGNFYTFSTILIEADKYYLLWWNCHNFSCCSNWREFGNSEVGIVWLFSFIKFWATICCGKNEGASIWFSSAKFLLLVVSGQSWMGDSSPASHGPTLTPTTRPSFLPTLLAEISLGHFIQWGREGHPTDNYSLLNLSRLCLPRALPLLWIHVWPCHCHFVISTWTVCGNFHWPLNAKERGHSNSFHPHVRRAAVQEGYWMHAWNLRLWVPGTLSFNM